MKRGIGGDMGLEEVLARDPESLEAVLEAEGGATVLLEVGGQDFDEDEGEVGHGVQMDVVYQEEELLAEFAATRCKKCDESGVSVEIGQLRAPPPFSPLPPPPPARKRVTSYWRQVAERKRQRATKRSKDFVTWQAQNMSAVAKGEDEFVQLPPAPVPKLTERPSPQQEQVLETSVGKMQRKKKKNKRIRVSHKDSVATQTVGREFFNAFKESRRRITVQLEQVPVSEQKCFQVLQSVPALPPDLKPSSEDLPFSLFQDEAARIAASFEAIRGILWHRKNAAMMRVAEHFKALADLGQDLRVEMAEKEFRKIEGVGAMKKLPGEKKRGAFLPGGVDKSSWNVRALENLLRAEKLANFKDEAPREPDASSKWEGSVFKISLMLEVQARLRQRVVFDVLVWNYQHAQLTRQLCLHRGDLFRRHAVHRAWCGLRMHHESRQWLRDRNREKFLHNKKKLMQMAWTAYKDYFQGKLVSCGKNIVAEAYLHTKRIWKAFISWRATLCVVEKYDALLHVCASQWHKKRRKKWALLKLRSSGIHSKLVRLRLRSLAEQSKKAIEFSLSCRVPFRWTEDGISEAWGVFKYNLLQTLQGSLDSSLLQVAKDVVALASFVVCDPPGLQSRTLAKIDQEILTSYLFTGRLHRKKTYPSERNRRSIIYPHVFMQLRPLGLQRLAARSLKAHVNALRSFLSGNSLVYELVAKRKEKKVNFMEANDKPDAVWVRARGIHGARNWRNELPRSISNRKQLVETFLRWKSTTEDIRSFKRGNQMQEFITMKLAFRRWRQFQKLREVERPFTMWRFLVSQTKQHRDQRRLSKFFRHWKTISQSRSLLRRVFTINFNPPPSNHDLTNSVFSAWRQFLHSRTEARNLVAADLHRQGTLLARYFQLWRQSGVPSPRSKHTPLRGNTPHRENFSAARRGFLREVDAEQAALERAALWGLSQEE